MNNIHQISNKHLSLENVKTIIENDYTLELSEDAKKRILTCRQYLDKEILERKDPIYGITTGFGSLCDHTISHEELSKLQSNLVLSHACGTGEQIPINIVKLMLLLKVQSLSYGNSGVQLETVQRLIDFYNNNIFPVVYEHGSLGASGDLAPLAHLCLPIIGHGDVWYKGSIFSAQEINKQFGWNPISLQAKEGLALLNGTQFMSAFAVYSILNAQSLSMWADTIGALSLDAFDGSINPFNANIQNIRHHNGQKQTAEYFRNILEGSELISRKKPYVQDPYSFRCIPQVHGASKDAINYVAGVIENEINAVTDNPTIFPDENLIISAGNFHGQPLALALDFLAIAMAELGSISERRVYQLINGKRDLPGFLVAKPGLNSGFMIPQYTAAAIVSQNKQLCMPASVDSIVSSQGQEDHVSMGSNAATKMYRVIANIRQVLGIELMNAAQAIEFRRPAKTSPKLEKIFTKYRKQVPFVENDIFLSPLIQSSVAFLENEDCTKF